MCLSLLDFEVVSALRGVTLGSHLSDARATDALPTALPVDLWPSAPALRLRSFSLRANLSAYDAAYIAWQRPSTAPSSPGMLILARTSGHSVEVRALSPIARGACPERPFHRFCEVNISRDVQLVVHPHRGAPRVGIAASRSPFSRWSSQDWGSRWTGRRSNAERPRPSPCSGSEHGL